MNYAIAALFVFAYVFSVAVIIGLLYRVMTGVFCETCSRPAYRCSCIEDGLVPIEPEPVELRKEATIPTDVTAAVEQAIKARKKPLDS